MPYLHQSVFFQTKRFDWSNDLFFSVRPCRCGHHLSNPAARPRPRQVLLQVSPSTRKMMIFQRCVSWPFRVFLPGNSTWSVEAIKWSETLSFPTDFRHRITFHVIFSNRKLVRTDCFLWHVKITCLVHVASKKYGRDGMEWHMLPNWCK